MIDNKLCGDWQGLPKCPEMEAGLYQKYAEQYPDGPKAAEALYKATYRQGVLVTCTAKTIARRAQQAASSTPGAGDRVEAEVSAVRLHRTRGQHRLPRAAGHPDLRK